MRSTGMGVCALLLVLSGCASMSEEQCRRADWQQQGLRDGRNGYGRSRVGEHAEACAKAGIVPDEARWLGGWSEGLRQYCRPTHGWELGLRGEYYRGVCANQPDGEDFERYYEAAKRVYQVSQQLEQNYSEMQRLERSLADAKTDEERKHLRGKLRELDIEQQRLRSRQRVELSNAPR